MTLEEGLMTLEEGLMTLEEGKGWVPLAKRNLSQPLKKGIYKNTFVKGHLKDDREQPLQKGTCLHMGATFKVKV